jgi:hypothetical protein
MRERVGVPSRDADGGDGAGGVVRRERQRPSPVLLRLHRCHGFCAVVALIRTSQSAAEEGRLVSWTGEAGKNGADTAIGDQRGATAASCCSLYCATILLKSVFPKTIIS